MVTLFLGAVNCSRKKLYSKLDNSELSIFLV